MQIHKNLFSTFFLLIDPMFPTVYNKILMKYVCRTLLTLWKPPTEDAAYQSARDVSENFRIDEVPTGNGF